MRTKSALAGLTSLLGFLVPWCATGPVHAQTTSGPETPAAPVFEVTSVRPYNPGPGQRATTPASCVNGTFRFSGPVELAIRWGYGIDDFQLLGGPAWVRSFDDYFAIEAKAAGADSTDQCRIMVQGLLADRFKMVAHHESKKTPVYLLVVDRDGTRNVTQASGTETANHSMIRINGSTVSGGGAQDRIGMSMDQLSTLIDGFLGIARPSGEARRPVINRTKLEGLYKFSLDFGIGMHGGEIPGGFVDVFAALRKQMGLALQEATEPFDMLVIDKIERPDPN